MSSVTVEGPVNGGQHGFPFFACTFDLEQWGYVEEEFFVSGRATSFAGVGPVTPDGHWPASHETGSAPFTTRILVRRPKDPSAFNGTVVAEWSNVSVGHDVFAGEGLSIYEHGFAFVAISAQYAGVVGFENDPQGLKHWDAQRYGSLEHPGDAFSSSIFAICGAAVGTVRDHDGVDPLAGLRVERVIATGGSQSAARLATYINGLSKILDVFDGFLPYVWTGRVVEVADNFVYSPESMKQFTPEQASEYRNKNSRIREDVPVPVLVLCSESETLFKYATRQSDSNHIRVWEVAGTSHGGPHFSAVMGAALSRAGLRSPMGQRVGMELDWSPVFSSALVQLNRWIANGIAATSFSPIEVAEELPEILRDESGNARGGVRLPGMRVPLAKHQPFTTPQNFRQPPCVPFTLDEVVAMYGDASGAITLYDEAAADAVADGTILAGDAPRLREDYLRQLSAAFGEDQPA